jgi:hypothetical protein
MATSGGSDITRTANDIITDALEDIGIIGAEETADNADVVACRYKLNNMIKMWMASPNFVMPGLRMWKRKRLTLNLSASMDYTVKIRRLAFTSGGTHEILVGDTLTGGTGAATADVMNVTVTSGTWAGGDAAGDLLIESQSGTFESETLNEGANSNVCTITTDSEAYGPPTDILLMNRKDTSNNETPMTPMTVQEWHEIGKKTSTGSPQKYYFERRKDEMRLWLNCVPATTTDVLFMVVLMPIEDFDANTDNPDFPREWFQALSSNLALLICPKFGKPITQDLKFLADQSLAIAQTFELENADISFEPDKD